MPSGLQGNFGQIKFGWDWQRLTDGSFVLLISNLEKLFGVNNLAECFSESEFTGAAEVDQEEEDSEDDEFSGFNTVILNSEISEKIQSVLDSCRVLLDPYQDPRASNILCHIIEQEDGCEVVNSYFREFPL